MKTIESADFSILDSRKEKKFSVGEYLPDEAPVLSRRRTLSHELSLYITLQEKLRKKWTIAARESLRKKWTIAARESLLRKSGKTQKYFSLA